MNLSRAKTILIGAFLGLNLFLCYHLFGAEVQKLARVAVTARELRFVEEHISGNGYLLEAKVDRTVRKSSFLTVSPSSLMHEELRRHFTPAAALEAGPGEVRLYRGEKARLRIFPNGLARVDFTPEIPVPFGTAGAGDRELASAVQHYLQSSGMTISPVSLEYLERSGENLRLHYVQVISGAPLYGGYLNVFLEKGCISAIELYWLEPETRFQEREMEVIPATEALLRLVEVLGPSPHPRRIIRIDLGFYSCEYDAEKWEVPPVWHFLFDDGTGYFVNAFTGNLELETSN